MCMQIYIYINIQVYKYTSVQVYRGNENNDNVALRQRFYPVLNSKKVYKYTYIHIYMYICILVYKSTYIQIYIYTNLHIYRWIKKKKPRKKLLLSGFFYENIGL